MLDHINGILNDYCIDTNAPVTSMQLDSSLQKHTCYSCNDDLTADQAMESNDIGAGKLRFYLSIYALSLMVVNQGDNHAD